MTIYTKYTPLSAASEIARIYENSGNQSEIIIGFNANGEIDYGFNNVTTIPDLIIKDQHCVVDFVHDFSDPENWTDEEREEIIDGFEIDLRNADHDIEFSCDDEVVDTDEDTEMETHIIQRDNDKNLRFTGELIASKSSSGDKQSSDSSGKTGRWTELNIYRTAGGNYICEQIGHSKWVGEHERRKAGVCKTP